MRWLMRLLSLWAVAATSQAATLVVDDDGPADYNNIQAAIYAAADGDTILVVDGTHRGPDNRAISFNGKAITIRSENGPERCVIDCEHKGGGFSFFGARVSGAVVDGFTIMNGSSLTGSAIYCAEHALGTVRNCIIRDNATKIRGAGVHCDSYASVTLVNCLIYANTSQGNGGGIRCDFGELTLTDCTIALNSADRGGGLYCSQSPAQIINCTFLQNTAATEGGAICWRGRKPTILNCAFIENHAGQAGGAISLDSEEATVVANCTFSDNTAGVEGGGIGCGMGRQTLKLVNCLFTRNTSHAIYNRWKSPILIQFCLFHENQPGDYYDYQTGTATGAVRINYIATGNGGNRTGQPGFAVAGDVRLTAASRSIDGGADVIGTELPATDLDGNPRIIQGAGGPAFPDMGACEYNPDSPSIAVSACTVEFVKEPNTSTPQPVTLYIGRAGGGILNWRIEGGSPWLAIEPATGTTADLPSQVTLTTHPEGMSRGIYQALLKITDSNAVNSPRQILVTLRVKDRLLVPAQYATIQQALDVAARDEIIEVAPGVYPESLSLSRPLHLIGIGRPIITLPVGAYRIGIGVEASGCTVDGFEITGGDTGIYVSSSNNMIRNNLITGSKTGMSVGSMWPTGGSSNTLLDNEIAECSETGLYIFSGGQILRGNRMHDNLANIRLAFEAHPSDIDTSNTVDGKPILYLIEKSGLVVGADSEVGCIVAFNCSGLTISGLTLSHNASAITLVGTRHSRIERCVATDNSGGGIVLQYSSANSLIGNTVIRCGYGISLYNSADNVLRDNAMADNRCNFRCDGYENAPKWTEFQQDITPSNTVNGKPIYYLVGAKQAVIDGSSKAGCVYAVKCSDIIVRDVVLENNWAGVVFVGTQRSRIENVVAAHHDRAGILLRSSLLNTLAGNFISGNVYGVEITSYDQTSGTDLQILLDRTTVFANRWGVMAYCPDLKMTNCLVAHNSAGGIRSTGMNGRFANCTIQDNGHGENFGPYPAGISCAYSAGMTVTNSIGWGNRGKQIHVDAGTAEVAYSDIQGGYAGEGNLQESPGLTPDGHLCLGSPCIGAGRRDADSPCDDIDGEPRDPNVTVDIGCDQYMDADGDRLPDWWELKYFGDRTAAKPDDDSDDDGYANVEEYELYSSDPTTPES